MKVNVYEIFIYNTNVRGYFPVSEMGHVAMLHSQLRRSFSIKSLIDEYKLNRFSFKRLDDDSLYNV